MWLGESFHNLDAKHRVSLPKRFQEGLDRPADGHPTAIVTRGFEDCLFLFSETGFRGALERLKTQAFAHEQERKMQRLFFSQSRATQLDAAGRLLLPEGLRSRAGIQKEVALIGLIDRIEIWAKDRWQAYQDANGDDFDRLGEVLLGSSGADDGDG